MRLLPALLLLATAAGAQTFRIASVDLPESIVLHGDRDVEFDIRVTIENASSRAETFHVTSWLQLAEARRQGWVPTVRLQPRETAAHILTFAVPASVLRPALSERRFALVVSLLNQRGEEQERRLVWIPLRDAEPLIAPGIVSPRVVSTPPGPGRPRVEAPRSSPQVVGTIRGGTVAGVAPPSIGFSWGLLLDANITRRPVNRPPALDAVEVAVQIENRGAEPWTAPFRFFASLSSGGRDGLRAEYPPLRFDPALAPGEARTIKVRFGAPVRLRIAPQFITPTSGALEVGGALRLEADDRVRIEVQLSSEEDPDISDNGILLRSRVDDRLRLILDPPHVHPHSRNGGSGTVTVRPRD